MIIGIAPMGSNGMLDNRLTAPLKAQIDIANTSGANKLPKVNDSNGYVQKANGLNNMNGPAKIDITV